MTATTMTLIDVAIKARLSAAGRRLCAAALLPALLGGCAGLLPKAPPQPVFYALDSGPPAAAPTRPAAAETARPTTAATARPANAATARPANAATAPTLIVDPPRAAAGYDSARIIYLRTPLRLEYYAQSEWVDTPARLLAPLLVAAIERTGAFGAVTAGPGSAAGELRLSSELLRLQHDFSVTPSQVHVTLRASLIDNKTRRVLAVRQFERSLPADSEDAYGGVRAAHRAVQSLLEELAVFTADAAGRWSASAQPGGTGQ